MRVPKNFQQSVDDPSWLDWNVRIVGGDEPIVFRFATIQFGEFDGGMHWIEQEFTLLSRASDNGFGLDIYRRAPQPEDIAKHHWLVFLTQEKFLKVIARAELDFNARLEKWSPKKPATIMARWFAEVFGFCDTTGRRRYSVTK
jgi:hypothetical protein